MKHVQKKKKKKKKKKKIFSKRYQKQTFIFLRPFYSFTEHSMI